MNANPINEKLFKRSYTRKFFKIIFSVSRNFNKKLKFLFLYLSITQQMLNISMQMSKYSVFETLKILNNARLRVKFRLLNSVFDNSRQSIA